jgi:hypothetical protein
MDDVDRKREKKGREDEMPERWRDREWMIYTERGRKGEGRGNV